MRSSEKKPGRTRPEIKKSPRPLLKKSPGRRTRSEEQDQDKHEKKHVLVKKQGPARETGKPRVKKASERIERGGQKERPQRDRTFSEGNARTTYKRKTDAPKPVKKTYQRDDERNSLNPGLKAVRLNKYIANAGICSRRDADKLIESGAIKVNGKTVTELGTKIQPGDVVQYGDQRLKGETLRYILLNKPKGFICTLEDPQERRTVMELVRNACSERIYPVGRLDRNTTGLLLLTNDGELAKKLTHPRHRVKKVYQVELNKPLTKNDMVTLADGVDLEDGFIAPDAIAYAENGEDKKKVGVEIHSGRNRIVRRMFEKLDYEVVKLDRVIFANLSKKDLPRGKWRHLTAAEINILRRVQ